MTQQTWHIFLCLAATCFSVGTWLIPCLLLQRQHSKHYVTDECRNLHSEQKTVTWQQDSFDRYLTPQSQHFLAYERKVYGMRLVDRYAIFVTDNKPHANIIALAGEFSKIRNTSCTVLVSCGQMATEEKHTGRMFYQGCPLPYRLNKFRAMGTVVRCDNTTDAFFWIEGKGAWTKMLRLGGNRFVCSEFASCPYDRSSEVAEEFDFVKNESECGTRVFTMKRELPLWLKAQSVL